MLMPRSSDGVFGVPRDMVARLTCSRKRTKRKPSQFKLQDSQMGLIFRSALPEELVMMIAFITFKSSLVPLFEGL